jgi:hypothetical protein
LLRVGDGVAKTTKKMKKGELSSLSMKTLQWHPRTSKRKTKKGGASSPSTKTW